MHIVEGFCLREVLGETIAVPTQAAAGRLSGLASMNESGQFLFRLLQTEQTEEGLIDALTETYDVEREVAASDIAEFLNNLRASGLLIETERSGTE